MPLAPVAPDLETQRRSDVQPRQLWPHKVVVLNCQCHSFDDVEVALVRIIGMSRERAHQHAWEAHTTGASVVAREPKERAEHYATRLKARGLRVTVEADT